MKHALLFIPIIFTALISQAQTLTPEQLIEKVKLKLEQVNNYKATGEMKTNISFLKVPNSQVTVYFKKPNKLKIKNEKGISLVPKGTVSISLNTVLKGNYQALDAGTSTLSGITVRVIKLLPTEENSEVVLSTLYIDVARLLVLQAKTTTRENGTHELQLTYNKYAAYALPDKVLFTFNTSEYKLPKGVTFDYDDGSEKKKPAGKQDQRGKIEITYSTYEINKGVSDAVFN
jgi:outer membrane lipoprotein-sorting protein